MSYILSSEFSYAGRKGNQFYEKELAELLEQGNDLNTPVTLGVKGEGEALYTATLEKSKDGKEITLDASLRRDGHTFETKLKAVQVKKDLYEITQLTFDNRKEKLDARWEMTKVIAHIGKAQLKTAAEGKLPEAHKEKGKFGKISRFFDRMTPNDPISMMPPPF